VDEEHEASYKNSESPRYHARDVAAVRARLEGARLVLGSATPSLETMVRAADRLRLLRLPERIGSRPLPPVEVVDLRVTPQVDGTGSVAWSEALDAAIVATLARGEQALLLLNRRGYAAFLHCPDCGEVWQCPRCSISLTVHTAPPGSAVTTAATRAVALTCRKCAIGAADARGRHPAARAGAGEPGARLARMDLDTTSTAVPPADSGPGRGGRRGPAARHR
jgi:primosomal protein N' (replication factor Y)